LIAALLAVGFWPRVLTDIIQPSVARIIPASTVILSEAKNLRRAGDAAETTGTLRSAQGDKPGDEVAR
jgi:hypothetical protein